MNKSIHVTRSIVRNIAFRKYAIRTLCRPVSTKCTFVKQVAGVNGAGFVHRSHGICGGGQRGYCSTAGLPDHFKVPLPALSPTMESGTLVRWTKQEGEQINEGDLLAEIETDKATMGFETPEEGYLAKILIQEGSKDVPIGKLMCIIVPELEDVAAFKDYTGSDVTTESAPISITPAATSGSYPPYREMLMPAQSPTMTHGDILSWEKNEGEFCNEGDVLLRIKTDKADIDVESPEDAFVAKIMIPAGTDNVPLGQLLCVFVEHEDDVKKFAEFTPPAVPAATIAVAQSPKPTPSISPPSPASTHRSAPTPIPKKKGDRIFATPFAKKLAIDKGIDMSLVQGTGPDGQIRAGDVEGYSPLSAAPSRDFIAPPPMSTPTPLPGVQYVDIPLTSMRKVIAKRLLESKSTIPHYYLSVDISMEQTLKLRKELNEQLKNENVKLSVNDFVIKAASLACKKIPAANSSWQGDFIRQFNTVDVNVAVATDNGLITPIVTAADRKGLANINQDVQRLAAKAKEGTLLPAEFQGGTFTISNLGMYGVRNFSAIINPPQACILAVGGAEKRLVPDEDHEKGYRVDTVMSVTLSCDHRVVDGAVGAQWLQHFRRFLEKPSTMLL